MTTTDTPTGQLRWVADDDPRWDADRERVFATVPDVVFRSVGRQPGERLAGDWWRVEDAGRVVGYGWLDDVWGDAEILLAVEEGARGTGVGMFVLARLEEEAAARGLNYVVNVVRDTHPQRDAVTAWFLAHGFSRTEDGALHKRVGDRGRDIGRTAQGADTAGRPGTERTGAAPDDDLRAARYLAERERAEARPHDEPAGAAGEPMGPGHEEAGGYVDPERHRY